MNNEDINKLTSKIIGLAIETHRELGPGLLETVYKTCLAYELRQNNVDFMSEKQIPIIYKEIALECGFRADIIVENSIILELKAVGKILPIHQAQLITYLKLTGFKMGFIFNFNVIRFKDGIRRIML